MVEATLLAADEPAPVTVQVENAQSPVLILADHAGNLTPRALGLLGLSPGEFQRHIAWDIGIATVCRVMVEALDATLIQQNYSRLVIDCNRPPGAASIDPGAQREHRGAGKLRTGTKGSGLRALARFSTLSRPYRGRTRPQTARRPRHGAGRDAQLTPVYKGVARPWEVGVMYNRDPRLAHLLLATLKQETGTGRRR